MTTSIGAEHTFDAGGIETSYLEAGSGEPVIMLHGSGPKVSALANWQHNIPALSQRFHLLAEDIVGFGATERPNDIVYSLGGRIALQMAAERPDRITKMVLMGARGIRTTLTDGLAALRAYEPSHAAMRDLLRNYFAVDPTVITDELVSIRYEASIADGAYEAYRTMFFDPRHTGSELGITENEVRAITTPTLLMHGRDDKVVPVQVSVTMLPLLPNAGLHVFSGCGHWTQIERADEFSALVADYLARP
jgi:pimeloyl-ACP methyl ester carboxylesterase